VVAGIAALQTSAGDGEVTLFQGSQIQEKVIAFFDLLGNEVRGSG